MSADDEARAVSTDGGLRVELPEGSVSGNGTLTINQVTGPGGQEGWSVELDGTELVGEATLHFEMPELDADEPLPLVSFNSNSDESLTPVASRQEDGELVVVTDHFSNWFIDRWSDLKNQLVSSITAKLDRLASAAGEGKHPRCESEETVKDEGLRVRSDSGRRVYWCLGREGGDVVLKTVNARGYGVAAESTPGLRVRTTDRKDMLSWLSQTMKSPPSKSGNHVELAGPGDRIEYAVFDDTTTDIRAGVTLRADAGAYLLTAAGFAVDTAAMLLGKVKTGKKAAHLEAALKGASCAQAFSSMATTDLDSAADAQGFFSDALTMSFDCIGSVLRDMDYGPVNEWLVEPMMWLWSGALTTVNGLVAAVDTGSELFGVSGYTIVLTRPAPSVQTVVKILDPFTDTGLKPGWSLDRSSEGDVPVDCSYDEGSWFALGPATHDCGTVADSTAACWAGQFSTAEVWCLSVFEPGSRRLFVRAAENLVDDTPAPADPMPLYLELTDGSLWWARIGGSWSGRPDGWNGAYGCANTVGLCARTEAGDAYFILAQPETYAKIEDSEPEWRVTVGTLDSDGDGEVSELEEVAVKTAWFITGHRWYGD